jgi:hypothetical protein
MYIQDGGMHAAFDKNKSTIQWTLMQLFPEHESFDNSRFRFIRPPSPWEFSNIVINLLM